MILIELLHASQDVFFIVLAVIGLSVGSFLNVVIHRLPIMLEKQWQQDSTAILYPDQLQETTEKYNLVLPSSHCPICQHKIKYWENIPVISFLLLKRKCSACKTSISFRYPAIECITAVITLLVGWHFGVTTDTMVYCLLSWSLLALTMIDIDSQLLPDSITLPLLWAGLIFNSFNTTVSLHDAVWGAIAGYLALWSVYWGYKVLTGKEGMGYGDFKLLAALGAWLGWFMLPMIILLSSLVGTLTALTLIALKVHNRSQPIPFGPYLAAAGFIALLWGDQIIKTYFQVMMDM